MKRRRQFVRRPRVSVQQYGDFEGDELSLTDKQLIHAVLDEKCKHISQFIDTLMAPKSPIDLVFESTPIVKSPTYAWRLVERTKYTPFTEGETSDIGRYTWVKRRIT